LRDAITNGDKDSDYIKDMIEQGKLVDSDITMRLLKHKILIENQDCEKFIIDGYPSSIERKEIFESEIYQCHVLIYLKCDKEVVTERLKLRGRQDDLSTNTVESRIKTFETLMLPVIDSYRAEGKLVEINANVSLEEVYKNIDVEMKWYMV